jgi:predicted AlkP superfamily phosphohydrolase/phosphomutase
LGAVTGGTALLLLFFAAPATAYIGPGAGFAFVSTFFVFFIAFFLALATILTWPLRWLVRALFRRRSLRKGGARQVVVLGLDGQDPELTERFMAEGLLPNFARLRDAGAFTPLRTTIPAESPVAWSSFMTGCNPGKHNIYDFLVPDRRSMLPILSSAAVAPPRRTLKVGRYRIPLGRPRMSSTRKGKTFWKILGEHGIFSSVVRVPLTFPPERFNGVLLSAMCVPDLKGSQGTFFYYTSDTADDRKLTSGLRLPLDVKGGEARGVISGPENSLVEGGDEMEIPFRIRLDATKEGDAELRIGSERLTLPMGSYTPWIAVTFRPGLGMKVRGICRFLLLETSPHVRLYVTPLQIDPGKPALPISHPFTYAVYLARSQGPYATLGVAEDTSSLNENVIDEEAFLAQCGLIHDERERMFFDALDKTPRGAVIGVFDITDRVQHMFLRYLDDEQPPPEGDGGHRNAVRDIYVKMDGLLGRVMEKIGDDSVLMVMSDHGFKPFRRGVNLNAWLRREGYLAVRKEADGADIFRDIDWEATRAYTVGFGGIYLNLKGREARGTVEPGEEAASLKREIAGRLLSLRDDEKNRLAVKNVFDRDDVYRGPYVDGAPDLMAGFQVGYRAAWHAVTGGVGDRIFEDNLRPWGGDHNMNPEDVPGIFFCNRAIDREELHIEDIAPTVLDIFGVTVPGHIDGKAVALR